VEEDLMPEQTAGVAIHYASRIEDVLAVALPKSEGEEKKDEQVREEVLQHASA
jgi:ATP-dependent Lon protease